MPTRFECFADGVEVLGDEIGLRLFGVLLLFVFERNEDAPDDDVRARIIVPQRHNVPPESRHEFYVPGFGA